MIYVTGHVNITEKAVYSVATNCSMHVNEFVEISHECEYHELFRVSF